MSQMRVALKAANIDRRTAAEETLNQLLLLDLALIASLAMSSNEAFRKENESLRRQVKAIELQVDLQMFLIKE